MNIYQSIIAAVEKANNIVITAHKSPDGDSIGSSLGLKRALDKMGKTVHVCHPDKAPKVFQFLNDASEILNWDEQAEDIKKKVQNADLIFALDYNDFSRMGEDMGEFIEQFAPKTILIDHHLYPKEGVQLLLSDTNCCSTAQLVFDVLDFGAPHLIDSFVEEPLYLGIMTDTGSFRFPSVQERTHQILGRMIADGLQHYKIHEAIFDSNTLDRLKLRGYATSEKLTLLHNDTIAMIHLSTEELDRFHYQKGDTEGLVNLALSIDGVKAAVFLYEYEGKVKMSFRGKGDYEVNTIASDHFQGGGHKYAAGGISFIGLDETVAKIKAEIPNYFAL